MTNILSLVGDNRKEVVRFFKFAVVGTIGAMVDFGVYNALIAFVHPSPPIADWVPEIAVFFSLSAAIVSNFIWNRYWTYPDSRSKSILKQFAQFYLINVLAYIIRAPIIALTKGPFARLAGQTLSLETETAVKLGENLAWALGVGIALFWNFFVNRIWTYSDVDDADRD
jgi:putative flippase GtrA